MTGADWRHRNGSYPSAGITRIRFKGSPCHGRRLAHRRWYLSPLRSSPCAVAPKLRLAPPLVLTTAQADTFLAAFPAILQAAKDAQ